MQPRIINLVIFIFIKSREYQRTLLGYICTSCTIKGRGQLACGKTVKYFSISAPVSASQSAFRFYRSAPVAERQDSRPLGGLCSGQIYKLCNARLLQ